MDIKVNFKNVEISLEKINEMHKNTGHALDSLWSGKGHNGWVKAPLNQDQKTMDYILNVADIVKQEAEMMVVLGTQRITLPARAAIDALPDQLDGIDVRFAGQNFCGAAMKKLMMEVSRRGTVICVISRKGEDPEVISALSLLKELMLKKYGNKEDVDRRTIFITEEGSDLYEKAKARGQIIFGYPGELDDLYGALTPAGLFPMAVAGIDVKAFVDGAKVMATSPRWDSDGTDYAIIRQLMKQSENIERISTFDTRLEMMCRWLECLYRNKPAESIPTISQGFYSRVDSDGIFETILSVEECGESLMITEGELEGQTFAEISRMRREKELEYLERIGRKTVELCLLELSPFQYGQLVYFLQTICDITAVLDADN